MANINKGQYGGDAYNAEQSGQCTGMTDVNGVMPCPDAAAEDQCLIGTIMRMTASIWVGTRTEHFGGGTFQAKSYPACKALLTGCVANDVIEDHVDNPGQPSMVYLRLANCHQ